MEDGLSPGKVGQSWGEREGLEGSGFRWNLFISLNWPSFLECSIICSFNVF